LCSKLIIYSNQSAALTTGLKGKRKRIPKTIERMKGQQKLKRRRMRSGVDKLALDRKAELHVESE